MEDTCTSMFITVTILVASLYFLIQRKRRFQRRQRHDSLDAFKDRAVIMRNLITLEDPFLYRLGLELALFKTYSIPSISKVLHATQEFQCQCLKRYDDTDLILRTMIEDGIDTKRGKLALGRLNHIHGMFSISNDDYLYTLAAFVLEPEKAFEAFGWRRFTKNEQEATFHWWSEVGTCMGITDIPASLTDLEMFRDAYEVRAQKFSPTNNRVAEPTLDLLLKIVPRRLKGVGKAAVMGILEPKLVASLGFDKTSMAKILACFIKAALRLRGLCIYFLALPMETPRRRTPATASGAPNSTAPKGLPVASSAASSSSNPDHKARFSAISDEGNTAEDAAELLLVPNFDVYGTSYPEGYRISELGPRRAVKGEIGEIPARHNKREARGI